MQKKKKPEKFIPVISIYFGRRNIAIQRQVLLLVPNMYGILSMQFYDKIDQL